MQPIDYTEQNKLCISLSISQSFDELGKICRETIATIEQDSTLESNERIRLRIEFVKYLADIESMNGRFDAAEVILQELLDQAIQLDNKSSLVRVYGTLGANALRAQKYSSALDYLLHALDTLEGSTDLVLLAGTYCNIGVVYWEIANYASALEWYAKAHQYAEQAQHTPYLLNIRSNLANVYTNLGLHEKAIQYYTEVGAGFEAIGNRIGVIDNLANLGSSYGRVGQTEKAEQLLMEGIAIAREIVAPRSECALLVNLGNSYWRTKKYKDALECMEKSLALAITLSDQRHIALCNANIASILLDSDAGGESLTRAEEYLFKAIEINVESGKKNQLCDCYERLATLYAKLQQWEDAYRYHLLYHTLHREVVSEEASQRATNFEHQRAVENAERDRQLKVARLQEQEKLLHRVLPASIAQRIVTGEGIIADYFESVTILFADIKGFTSISADMPAFLVVRFLDSIFASFDAIMKKYGCEKIKTIGDGYMAVSGAPIAREDHAEKMVLAAFDMLQSIQVPDEVAEYLPENESLGLRIGIHHGPVVAGVVGSDRFVYDIYSDAVNTASRMESHGEVNRIHVSADFARHIQNRLARNPELIPNLRVLKRGDIEIKGKGTMRTFYLEQN